MIEITDEKKEYLEAIKWLVSGSLDLGTGRTFLLAWAFIDLAVSNPGRSILIFDHIPMLGCTVEIMGREIIYIARERYPKGIFKFTQRSIRFDGFSP